MRYIQTYKIVTTYTNLYLLVNKLLIIMSFKERLKKAFLEVPADKRPDFKEAFNSVVDEVETPISETSQKFLDATLSDGTPIMIEPAVEVGAAVTVAVDGEIVPVENASHELADGTVIVTDGGVITEVIPVEGEVEVEEEMGTEAATTEAKDVPSPKTVIERTEVERKFSEMEESYNSKIAELTEANKNLSEKLDENANEYKEQFNKVLESIEVLLDFNTDKPTQAPKTSVGRVNKLRDIKSAFRNMRK